MVVAAILNVGAGVMQGGSGTGIVDFFHGFQVALMMTIMLNLTQFVYWRCKASRKGTCLQVHTPTFLMLLSAIMTNFQPMAILAVGSWKIICCACEDLGYTAEQGCTGRTMPPWPTALNPDGSQIFRPCTGDGNWFWQGTHERCTGQVLPIFPTAAAGWAIQIIMTYGGFVVMFVSVMQATQMHKKVQAKWRSVRTSR